jgi:mRNA interferase MazF
MKTGQIKRGDVWLVDLNPTRGSEVSKERPTIVVSNDINNLHSDLITVIPCSTNVSDLYPVEVLLQELKYPSKAMCDQIRALSKERFVKKVATLSSTTMGQIAKAVLLHLDIEEL